MTIVTCRSTSHSFVMLCNRYDAFVTCLDKYIADPFVDHTVHDLRKSIRRFESSYYSLPKSSGTKKSKKIIKIIQRLFKKTGGRRDTDVILSVLLSHGVQSDCRLVLNLHDLKSDSLQACTVSYAKRLYRRIEKFRCLCCYCINRTDIHNMVAIQKKMVWRVFDEITLLSDSVYSEESDSEALHTLRKKIKRLRYLLEDYLHNCVNTDAATADYTTLSDILHESAKLQKSTGLIHDSDITLQYVKKNYKMVCNCDDCYKYARGADLDFVDAIQKKRRI